MKTQKKVTCAFRTVFVLSIIQSLIERKLKFTIESEDIFSLITVYGFEFNIEAFPIHHHQIAYTK